MRCSLFGLLVAIVGLVGCDVSVTVDGNQGAEDAGAGQAAGEESGGGFNIQIGEGGASWDTPFSKGSVKDGKVDVDAPGTNVDVDMSTGETKVRAPGTSVDVK